MTRCLVALVLGVCCLHASAQGVAAGQVFTWSSLTIRAPNSEGWRLGFSSDTIMAFGRRGPASNESYTAQVILFELPESRDRDDFVSLIKQGIEKDTSPERFTTIEASVEYTEQRSYPCVRYKGLLQDKQARTPSGRESLKLQVHSLYCRHPRRQGAGFAIIFSHRGAGLVANLDSQATAFIDGVQVPDK